MGFTSLQTGGPLALLPKAWVDGNHLVVYMFLLLSFKTCIFFWQHLRQYLQLK